MTDRKRLLVLSGVWPHVRESTEAANVVLHETLSHLIETKQFDIAFARVSADNDAPLSGAVEAIRALEARGLTMLESVTVTGRERGGGIAGQVARYLTARPGALLPGARDAAVTRARCDEWRADCVLAVWSESATASLYKAPVPRMAYYGNPDHKVARAQIDFERVHRPPSAPRPAFIPTLKARLSLRALKRAHLKVMRGFDAVGDVAANDAEFYRRNGVRAFYTRNMWPSGASPDWEADRDRTEQTSPLKIVGNVGNLSATGNTYGLVTLATTVLPALKRTLGEGNFEIHLFGGRQPHPYVVPLLNDPHIRTRGFVKDIDAEILSAPVFLIANNQSDFVVGHTRFLHAWSLGACVVAFASCADAMPEIVDRRNALLAFSPDQMAAQVAEAAKDIALRRSLGRAGAATVVEQFDPATVTRSIADRLLAIAEGRRL